MDEELRNQGFGANPNHGNSLIHVAAIDFRSCYTRSSNRRAHQVQQNIVYLQNRLLFFLIKCDREVRNLVQFQLAPSDILTADENNPVFAVFEALLIGR